MNAAVKTATKEKIDSFKATTKLTTGEVVDLACELFFEDIEVHHIDLSESSEIDIPERGEII